MLNKIVETKSKAKFQFLTNISGLNIYYYEDYQPNKKNKTFFVNKLFKNNHKKKAKHANNHPLSLQKKIFQPKTTKKHKKLL